MFFEKVHYLLEPPPPLEYSASERAMRCCGRRASRTDAETQTEQTETHERPPHNQTEPHERPPRSQTEPRESHVLVSPEGKCFHTSASCFALKHARSTRTLEACSFCAQGLRRRRG